MPDRAAFKKITYELERCGYVSVPDFLDAAAIAALALECRQWQAQDLLQIAGIGRGNAAHTDTKVRGDRTRWFDEALPTTAQSAYWTIMQLLRISINRSLWLGLGELEAHYAFYAPGTIYARHRDRFYDNDARVLSSVLYLNADWLDSEGGALRVYLAPTAEYKIPHVDIYPTAGTLVLFLSADFEHEVLPATRERMSIAGWYRQISTTARHSRESGNPS